MVSNHKVIRVKAGLNQSQFWSRIGVTQSGGSRYESGRNVPAQVKKLLTLAFGSNNEALSELAKLRNVSVDDLRKQVAK